jgi:hypothetical protein
LPYIPRCTANSEKGLGLFLGRQIRFEEEEERSSEGGDLFLDFDLEAGMLDDVDDEVRELLGNGGEILPSEGSAKPEWEASASFRI